MKMLSLGTYSQALIHNRPNYNMGLNGFPSPNALVSSKNPCTSSSRSSTRTPLTSQSSVIATAAGAGAGAGSGFGSISDSGSADMLANNPMLSPPEETASGLFSKWGLRRERMPKHVTVCLDGSRRWCLANNGGQLTYEPFYLKNALVADLCVQWGIPSATCFIFAACNWKRSDDANNLLFTQLQASLEANLEKFVRQGIRVSIIGEKWRLPKWFQDAIQQVEDTTKNGTTLDFRYAIPYGGREDIVDAARSISKKVKAGEIKPEDVNDALVEQHLSTGNNSFPDQDLMIRFGGKRRLSNFYLWQSSHAELYFSDALGPEFEESLFIDALRWFQQCDRRFGK